MAQLHWLRAVNGAFNTAADWSGGVIPGAGDDAILDAPGSAFTVNVTQNATVSSIQTASNALLDIQSNFSATGGTGIGANDGGTRVENGHTLTLQGTVANVGTMELFGTVSTTSIVLGSGGVTLDGGGAIFLNFSGGALQQIVPAAGGSVLTDVDNRISGKGLLGGPGLTIIVEAQGFLEAKAGPLVINTGANTIVNAGLIDAEGAPGSDGLPPGIGTVESPVANNGIVESGGFGSILTFEAAVTGAGRAIVHDGTLAFEAFFNQGVDFEGTTGVLALAQSVNYTTGVIAQFSTTGAESLDLGDIAFVGAGEATYSGTTSGGVLTVTDGAHTANIHLEGDYTGEAFIASGDGHGGTSVTTDGPKALHWLSAVSGVFSTASDWTGGLVPAAQNDAVLDAPGSTPYTVTASGSPTVRGVETAASATLVVTGAFNATNGTDGGANAGKITVATGGILRMTGAIANAGTISVTSSGAATYLGIGDNTTLSGGGTVALVGSNAKEDVIYGLDANSSLTNVDNTIAGAGDLGEGRLSLINQAAGVIDANGSSSLALLTLGTVANAGLIEATGSGGLSILSAVNNAGGGVIAAAGGKVYLEGADILGGTLRSSAGKFIYVASGVDTLDGTTSPVTNQGEVVVENGQTLNLAGSIVNTDLVVLVSDGAATTLNVTSGGAALSGGGQVFMVNSAEKIIGSTASSTLTNTANVIAGTGNVGGGRMTLINGAAGVIVGEGSVAALIVDTGANTIVNAGRIENTGKGGTLVKSAVANSGVLIAEAGTLAVDGAVTGSGVTVVYSGTLDFASNFSQTVVFRGTGGVLQLAQSQGFAATISGFSAAGGTSLDLGDIAFKSAGEATYSGTTTSGVLTVIDGTHTAHIHFTGNYLGSTWTASSDGRGGTVVVDPTASSAHRFITAAAGFAGGAVGSLSAGHVEGRSHPPMLARPGTIAP